MNSLGYVSVHGGHSIYYESYGKIGGIPAVILHGGPGGGMNMNSLKYYDLKKWFVIMFDQRGCGKSKPFGKLENNTTWDLVSDIETLRQLFQIEQWFVSGSSWGTTLGLLYAETYPERVTGLLLHAICLEDNLSQQWKRGYGGVSQIFPKEWEQFVKLLPPHLHRAGWKDIAKFYQSKLASNNAEARKYALAWWGWESAISSLVPRKDTRNTKQALALAKLENHYFVHDCWIEEGQILKNIDRLRNIPITLIHGRYDMLCQTSGAFAIADALPQAKLIILKDSGHSYKKMPTRKLIRKKLLSFLRSITRKRKY